MTGNLQLRPDDAAFLAFSDGSKLFIERENQSLDICFLCFKDYVQTGAGSVSYNKVRLEEASSPESLTLSSDILESIIRKAGIKLIHPESFWVNVDESFYGDAATYAFGCLLSKEKGGRYS